MDLRFFPLHNVPSRACTFIFFTVLSHIRKRATSCTIYSACFEKVCTFVSDYSYPQSLFGIQKFQ